MVTAMTLFAVIVFRTSGAERTLAAGSERRSGSLQFEK